MSLDAGSSRARVASFYDRTAGSEASRLDENVYRRLERDMTLKSFERFVPRGARVLDIGGGPGAYLGPLTKLGYEVSLCDLSRENVRIARRQAAALGDARLAKRIRQADATRLDAYAKGSFDAVLCAGPLYHLVDARARNRALSEIVRVLRPGGIAVLNVLPRLHPLRYLLREASPESLACLRALDWPRLLANGRYENPLGDRGDPTFFTDAYLFRVDELGAFARRARCRLLDLYSAESFCAFQDVALCEWIRNEADYRRLLELVDRTARDPAQCGAAEHLIAVLRSPRKPRA
jgi:SAM-dependent methyltransferase